MEKFKIFILLAFTIIVVSCSKNDDDSANSFFRKNGIKSKEYPVWSGVDNYKSSNVYTIISSFKINTDDYYIWFCDKELNIIGSTVINLPKQITEDQGYGNIVTCERDDYSQGIQFIDDVDDVELYLYEPVYNNLRKKFFYLLFYKERKIISHKINAEIDNDSKILKWYNNSLLLGSENYGYHHFICLSINGEIISINEFHKTSWNDIFGGSYIAIPLDYTKAISILKRETKVIEITSIDNENRINYSINSPFGSNENFIVNSASLLESRDSYYVIECQLTAYSGEKKTIKIKISSKENKAEIIS